MGAFCCKQHFNDKKATLITTRGTLETLPTDDSRQNKGEKEKIQTNFQLDDKNYLDETTPSKSKCGAEAVDESTKLDESKLDEPNKLYESNINSIHCFKTIGKNSNSSYNPFNVNSK